MRQERDTGRSVPGFESFTITEDGGVYEAASGSRLRSWLDADGYWRVQVWRRGKYNQRRYFNKRVSHLVAMTWLGIDPRRDGAMVWPLDGCSENHHADNLVAITATGDAVQFERDTRVNGTFDANQARNLRREWLSRQNFSRVKQNASYAAAYLL